MPIDGPKIKIKIILVARMKLLTQILITLAFLQLGDCFVRYDRVGPWVKFACVPQNIKVFNLILAFVILLLII